jgi:sugar lactone lactonase YvrE
MVPIWRLVRIAMAVVLLLASTATLSMALPGDLTPDRVLGQLDFTHNGLNILTGAGLIAPNGVAVDRSVVPNRVYVADQSNNRVLGWHSVDALTNGAPADLVIGQPDLFTSFACINVNDASLCRPSAVAVDGAGNLYVADSYDNRVLEYNSPFTTDTVADLVFGQNGSFTTSACNLGGVITDATLCNPYGIAVDTAGNVYISDQNNSRILEYDLPLVTDAHADMVFGQAGKFNSGVCNNGGVTANSLCNPNHLAVDGAGNLYVADGNSRVLEYNNPLAGNTTADLVFGQGNSFTSNTCSATPSADNFCGDYGVAVDGGRQSVHHGWLLARPGI